MSKKRWPATLVSEVAKADHAAMWPARDWINGLTQADRTSKRAAARDFLDALAARGLTVVADHGTTRTRRGT